MTEHNNPLMRRNPGEPPRGGGGGRITKEMIEGHVRWLNSLNWVRYSGKPYFVKTLDDGRVTWARST